MGEPEAFVSCRAIPLLLTQWFLAVKVEEAVGRSTCYHGCWMVREQAQAVAAPIHSWMVCYHALWQQLSAAPAQPIRLVDLVAD